MEQPTGKKKVKVPKDKYAKFKSASFDNYIKAKVLDESMSMNCKLNSVQEDAATALHIWKKAELWKEYTRYVKLMKKTNQI